MALAVCTSRNLLFLLGFIFLAATVATWGLGGYILATYKQIDSFSSAYYIWMPAVVMICVGIIFMFAGISGCASAYSSGRMRGWTITFFVFVFLTFTILVTATTLIFIYKRQISAAVDAEGETTFAKYDEAEQDKLSRQVDFVQSHLECCGAENYTSWENTSWGRNNHSHMVPTSCCRDSSECMGGYLERMDIISKYIYIDGCIDQMKSYLQTNLKYLAAGAVAFLLILTLGLIASCVLLCKKDEYPYFNLS